MGSGHQQPEDLQTLAVAAHRVHIAAHRLHNDACVVTGQSDVGNMQRMCADPTPAEAIEILKKKASQAAG